MALGLISIHAERAFPPEGEPFTRQKFGLPFFWSGHAQVGASLLILFGTQIVGWLAGLHGSHRFLNIDWPGNWLTQHFLLAGGLWLAGVYAYLYSDLVVRRVGVYTCLAAFCVVMAEATIAGRFLAGEGWIAVLAVTALGVNLVQMFLAKTNEKIARVLPPLAMVLGVLPILIGLMLHIRATSSVAAEAALELRDGLAVRRGHAAGGSLQPHVGSFVLGHVPALVGREYVRQRRGFAGGRGGSVASPGSDPLDATSSVADAHSDRVPRGGRLWRGNAVERPLGWVAHTAAAVILFHVLVASLQMVEQVVQPLQRSPDNLILGLVFAEAAVFYILAAIFRRRSANVYFATLAACGALWQFLGYCGRSRPVLHDVVRACWASGLWA